MNSCIIEQCIDSSSKTQNFQWSGDKSCYKGKYGIGGTGGKQFGVNSFKTIALFKVKLKESDCKHSESYLDIDFITRCSDCDKSLDW